MNRKKKISAIFVCIAIALMLVSMIGASVVQTSGGSVTVKQLYWETSEGYAMSGLLFVPNGVSATHKAPAIVTSHGMFNDKEMQDPNFVELSRRGYVVLAMDMFSHGDSQPVPNIGVLMTGAYEAVKMVSTLGYVDTSKIGLTGHSLGGMSINTAIMEDNVAPKQLISAALFNSSDPTYTDMKTKKFTNIFGSRDVGVIAGKYDEFFMRDVDKNGKATSPRDYLKYNNSQSFLHFGTDPTGQDKRVASTMYQQTIDGKDVVRVIYNPTITHPWSPFSSQSTTDVINFFNTTFPAPNPIAASNQVWQIKVFFNTLGLIGFTMFILSFAILMLFTQFFSTLRAKETIAIRSINNIGRIWFWGMAVATTAFSALTFVPVMTHVKSFTVLKDPWPQSQPYGLGMWALLSAAFIVVTMLVYYFTYGRKNGFSLAKSGIRMPWKNVGKTILLAIIVVCVSYSWVFFADYFFKTDFRIWLLAVPAFKSNIILISLFPYMFFFLAFDMALSVSVNSFNFVKIGNKEGEHEWINTTIMAVVNVLPVVIIILSQYIYFRVTGFLLMDSAAMQITWAFPFVAVIPAATIITRKIYRVTSNPYLPGIITGLIATLIVCSNTLTWS